MTPAATVQTPGGSAAVIDRRYTETERYEALMRELGLEAHAVLKRPSPTRAAALMATEAGRAELVAFAQRYQERIALAAADPLYWSFEPDTWRDADALLLTCDILGIFAAKRQVWHCRVRQKQERCDHVGVDRWLGCDRCE